MKQAHKLDRNLRYLIAVARRANVPWPWRACKCTGGQVGKTGGSSERSLSGRSEEKQRCSKKMLAARLRTLPLPHTPLLARPVKCVCCVWCAVFVFSDFLPPHNTAGCCTVLLHSQHAPYS